MANVVIVEDEAPLAQAYKTILETNKHIVHVESNGATALEYLKKHTPDIILLDMNMPKLNGLEFLKRLSDKSKRLNVIILSNRDDRSEIDEAFRLGAEHYILKSWASPRDLIKVVDDALSTEPSYR